MLTGRWFNQNRTRIDYKSNFFVVICNSLKSFIDGGGKTTYWSERSLQTASCLWALSTGKTDVPSSLHSWHLRSKTCIIQLGVEVAKNLILAGPKQITIYDPRKVTTEELGRNFYCRPEHVGKLSRAEASLDQLKDLNSSVHVSIATTDDIEHMYFLLYLELQTMSVW